MSAVGNADIFVSLHNHNIISLLQGNVASMASIGPPMTYIPVTSLAMRNALNSAKAIPAVDCFLIRMEIIIAGLNLRKELQGSILISPPASWTNELTSFGLWTLSFYTF